METPYAVADLQNPSTLQLVTRVMACAAARLDSEVIVTQVGYGLKQLDWSDETWNYVIVRGHPIWVAGRPDRRHIVIDKFVEAIRTEFKAGTTIEVEALGPDPEDRVVVRWGRSRHSIGD